ncbi:hypothetical protein CNMCM6936_006367 [Aspergillus lentulus]|nr:hypothetical protein CNMCM6069_002446 [Aspergillus lentulus]KAF4166660.1 hypothetical protein CNMCM6936_006367 [Aspergillus lentulus]KAF4171976.1 hypothetical protein CNMCM8060_002129 [Aspergillus lentulus]KAF4191486.1 hypothetical protein CNMCM8694_001753 [Aspergillus lentulus]
MTNSAQAGDDRQSGSSIPMTQGNTGSQDKGAESEDEVQLSEDEEDDGIPSLAAPTWKAEMLDPREQALLQKKSDEFDPTETYWKFRHIVEALKHVELAPEAATADAITLPDHEADPTTQENEELDPPSTCPKAENASGPASTFDGSKYVDASEHESELAGQIDAQDYGSD